MHVLVAYASRHGATQGIAERIAETLWSEGLDAEALPAASVRSLDGYDAFVIGSAAYMHHWLKDAANLVRRNRRFLRNSPVWLFSSGPIGGPTDAKGQDQRVEAVPKEIIEFAPALNARDHHVFFGAYEVHRKPIGFAERLAAPFMSRLPAEARDAMPEGDFRDWPEIEGWARGIARDLGTAPVPAAAASGVRA
ncbi:MAG: flavodoxin domain-containing protein [Candidatus Limnocylindrales bacterium]